MEDKGDLPRQRRSRRRSPPREYGDGGSNSPRLDLAYILNSRERQHVTVTPPPFQGLVPRPPPRATPTPTTSRTKLRSPTRARRSEDDDGDAVRDVRAAQRKRASGKARAKIDRGVSAEPKGDAREEGDDEETKRSTPPPAREPNREEKRRGRTCRIDGCDNYIVHKGLCCRHGGARKCTTEGCTSTAKYMGLCWKHGGSTWCKIEGCTKRAKAKGRCWAHGGGTKCSQDECTKVAVSNGFCWAHGGGKRCLFDGCNRPGYERTHGFCDRHFEEMQHVDYFEV